MKLIKIIFVLPLLLLAALASSAPDEAMGRVSKVVDGDTFDVQLQEHDSRISEDLIRIRLADIDCPETRGPKTCEAGKKAAAYTSSPGRLLCCYSSLGFSREITCTDWHTERCEDIRTFFPMFAYTLLYAIMEEFDPMSLAIGLMNACRCLMALHFHITQ